MVIERAQVWALDRDTGDLVYLPNGAADQLRQRTRDALVCPLPHCHGALSTRGGKRIRDHFFHLSAPAGAHGPETIEHLEAKAALASWARDQPGVAEVLVEHRLPCGRTPDVLVIWDNGDQLDLEFENKVTRPELRKYRDSVLMVAGVLTQWVWGSRATRKGTPRSDVEGTLKPGELMITLDPTNRSVTSWLPDLRSAEDVGRPPGTSDALERPLIRQEASLDACQLTPGGIVPPAVARFPQTWQEEIQWRRTLVGVEIQRRRLLVEAAKGREAEYLGLTREAYDLRLLDQARERVAWVFDNGFGDQLAWVRSGRSGAPLPLVESSECLETFIEPWKAVLWCGLVSTPPDTVFTRANMCQYLSPVRPPWDWSEKDLDYVVRQWLGEVEYRRLVSEVEYRRLGSRVSHTGERATYRVVHRELSPVVHRDAAWDMAHEEQALRGEGELRGMPRALLGLGWPGNPFIAPKTLWMPKVWEGYLSQKSYANVRVDMLAVSVVGFLLSAGVALEGPSGLAKQWVTGWLVQANDAGIIHCTVPWMPSPNGCGPRLSGTSPTPRAC